MTTKQKKDEIVEFPDLADACILLVDDEADMHEIVQTILEPSGANLDHASSKDQAIQMGTRKTYDVALIDMVLPDGNGMELVKHFREHYPDTFIIVITGHANHSMAYSLEDLCVQSVLTKPFSTAQLRFTLCKEIARRKLFLKEGIIQISDSSTKEEADQYGLIGNSAYIQNLRQKVKMFAQGEMPVLIQGPTGTGKEIIARSIHKQGSRHTQRMITVNSSAIPEHLEESEFFGHARGAFTGANEEKEGIIKCSQGSSLFLDEVGELSLRMQAKLLRVLDGHGYNRIGDSVVYKPDFRLISATNRPLSAMIEDGLFRQDLFFRLKAGIIETLPLKTHMEDVPLLVAHFLTLYGKKVHARYAITGEALNNLIKYDWPGNIRELKNVLDSLCAINNKSKTITRESIEWVIKSQDAKETQITPSYLDAKQDFEKKYYASLLAKHSGVITLAAKEAGIDRPNFSKKLKSLNIKAADYKMSG